MSPHSGQRWAAGRGPVEDSRRSARTDICTDRRTNPSVVPGVHTCVYRVPAQLHMYVFQAGLVPTTDPGLGIVFFYVDGFK